MELLELMEMRFAIVLLILIGLIEPALAWSHGGPYHNSPYIGTQVLTAGIEGNGSTDFPFLNVLVANNDGWAIENSNNCGTSVGALGANPFTTTNGMTTVEVAQTSHGLMANQLVFFSGATAVNGITLNGLYIVVSVVDANDYIVGSFSGGPTIPAASGSGSGGGASVTFTGNVLPQGDYDGTVGYMQKDSNGFPTTMVLAGGIAGGCAASAFFYYADLVGGPTLFDGSPTMLDGTYVLQYDGSNTGGTNTIALSINCNTPVSGGTNRVLYHCGPFSNVIQVKVTSINTSDHIRNYALIYSPDSTAGSMGTRETLYNNGPALTGGKTIWDPQYVAKIKPFSMLRFMDAFQIFSNPEVNWADRTPVGYYSYSVNVADLPFQTTANGLPFEAAVDLCNRIHANCWMNVPYQFSSSAITSYAQMVFVNLDPSLQAIVEYGNEFFNAKLSTANQNYVIAQSVITGSGSLQNQGITEQVAINDSWQSVFGSQAPARLIRGFGGQASNSGLQTFIMGYSLPGQFTGYAWQHADAMYTAPYWDFVGQAYPLAWSLDADPYLKFFQQLNGSPLVIPSQTAANCSTGGTDHAFTVSSNTANCSMNGSVPAHPANGTFVVTTMSVPATWGVFQATSSGTTLAVSSVLSGTLNPGVGFGVFTPEATISSGGPGTTGNYVVSAALSNNLGSNTFIDGTTGRTFYATTNGTNTITVTASDGTISNGDSIGRPMNNMGVTAVIATGSGTTGNYGLDRTLNAGSTTYIAQSSTLSVDGGNAYPIAPGEMETWDLGTGQWNQQIGVSPHQYNIFVFTDVPLGMNFNSTTTPAASWRQTYADDIPASHAGAEIGTMPVGVLYWTQNYRDTHGTASWHATISGTTMTVTSIDGSGPPTDPIISVGMPVVGAGVTPGTTIVTAANGGGIGAYTITPSQTVSSSTAMTATFGLKLLGYESGSNFVGGANFGTRTAWFNGAHRDYRMSTVETSYRTQMRNVAPNSPANQFNFIGGLTGFGDWSVIEGLYQATEPRYSAETSFHDFLLKRDLDPAANDNSPMWLNEAA
jgi:hypothetical protein